MKQSAARVIQRENDEARDILSPEVPISRRILIVDDEANILDAYRDILTPKTQTLAIKSSRSRSTTESPTPDDGFELTAVSTGEEAVAAVTQSLLEGKPFAMGFFDVLLGNGIDGIEAVKKIHSLDPDMYAVLVTAYQDRHVDAIHKVFGSEFQDRWDYLNKPFSEGEIRQKARNMVSMWNIRKRDEAQRAKLDEVKRRLGDNEKMLTVAAVARSVGHEFGNILLQIMGRADLAKGGGEAEMRKALETILVATEHASKVLERFKGLAKPTEDNQRFSLISIDGPIAETVTLMEHELKRRRVKIVIDVKNVPPIFASHSALVQVFMNLVINAMHAMKDSGTISFTGQTNGQNVELHIRDSGPGIPPDHLQKVFEPFFTTKGDKGTGLGLAICKEVIEIGHGGSISVSNHSRGGADFLISIPVHREGEQS